MPDPRIAGGRRRAVPSAAPTPSSLSRRRTTAASRSPASPRRAPLGHGGDVGQGLLRAAVEREAAASAGLRPPRACGTPPPAPLRRRRAARSPPPRPPVQRRGAQRRYRAPHLGQFLAPRSRARRIPPGRCPGRVPDQLRGPSWTLSTVTLPRLSWISPPPVPLPARGELRRLHCYSASRRCASASSSPSRSLRACAQLEPCHVGEEHDDAVET